MHRFTRTQRGSHVHLAKSPKLRFTAQTQNGFRTRDTVVDNAIAVWQKDGTEIMNSPRLAHGWKRRSRSYEGRTRTKRQTQEKIVNQLLAAQQQLSTAETLQAPRDLQ
jgi:hypothetical protein